MEKPLPQKFIQSTFKENEKKAEPLEKIRPHIQITNFLILLCSLILLLELYSAKSQEEIPPQVQQMILTNSSVQKQLFFDYPEHFELIDKIIALYGYKALVKPNELPAPGKFLYEESLKTPWWQGIYPQLTKRQEDKKNVRHAPLFEKIRQGEIWRLVSPILLHNDILHLFFNMIWLLLLGTQIESHISPFRYIFFILIVGILSNICQYLVSGPAFLGFSGVDVGMAFFIRARQKKAPWEGYLMSTGTFRFILFFITILTCISIGAFLLEVFGSYSFPMMIANTAHITGALIGWWLGSSRFFSWQHRYD
jgi:GlpG protein